ncbi:MAG: hypothetical protein CM15mP102_07640 [Flavobacteriales bacterium]|nr:MAG: hypothetical protein CM15mP102_07640 [Flavobacteriales bacterium]
MNSALELMLEFLNIEDIKTIGKLAKPPVPTTKLGLKT